MSITECLQSLVISDFKTKRPSEYFNETGSDKATDIHDYSFMYDMVFSELLLKFGCPLRILEIGVSYADINSGHAFCSMPYCKAFVGIDIQELRQPYSEKGTFIQGNAYDKYFVDNLTLEPFHLIIDDGSHEFDHQVSFFELYEDLLVKGGIMVCEDVPNWDGDLSHEDNRECVFDRYRKINDPDIHVMCVPIHDPEPFTLQHYAFIKRKRYNEEL